MGSILLSTPKGALPPAVREGDLMVNAAIYDLSALLTLVTSWWQCEHPRRTRDP